MEHFMGSATTSASATFVEQLYARFLHRSADAAGVQYWASEIDSGARNAAQVSAEFFKSAEFQQVVDPVVRLYFTAFGRIPDAAGVDYWAKAMQQGLSIKQVVNHFGNDAEFKSLYGTVSDTVFLDNLYHNAFGRDADTVGKQFFLDQLSHGASRADVVLQFSSSAEMYAVRGTAVKAVEQFIAVNDVAPSAAQLQSALATIDPIKLLTKLYGADNYHGAEVPGLSTSGVAVDGYIKGATVTMTIHETVNGVDTVRTVTRVTDDKGNFDFGDDAGFGALTMTGGTDIATGAPVNGIYTAVAGATVINPLTTLIQTLVEQGQDAAAAEALVKGKLGLDAALDLNTFDAIAAATATGASAGAQAAALKAQAVLAQVNTLMGQVGAALSGVGLEGGANSGANAAVDALATLLTKEGNIDLGAAATATQLLKDAATAAQATSAQNTAIGQIADNAGTAIANLNKAIADAAGGSGTVLENLIKIVTVQVASENIEQQMSDGAKAGNVTGALSNTTGSNLNNALDTAGTQIGDVDGNGAGDYTPPPAPEPDPTPPAPAFRATVANGVVSFSGTTTGDITMRALADGKVVFARGGVEDTSHPVALYGNMLTLNLAAGQQLKLTEEQAYSNDMAQVEVTGAGKVALQAGYLDNTALARLHPGSILLDGSGEGASIYDRSYIPLDTTIVLDDDYLYGYATGLSGRHISGDGVVEIYGESTVTADLSGITASTVNFQGNSSNLLFQSGFHAKDYSVYGDTTMTAAQASGSTISSVEGTLYILGSAGAQAIDTSNANSAYIEGGAGADTLQLGDSSEVISIAFAGTGAKLEQKITLSGTYSAGDKIYLYTDGAELVYTVKAEDLSGAAPLTNLAGKLSTAFNAHTLGHAITATAGTGANAGTVTLVSNDAGKHMEFDYDISRASDTQTDTFTLGGRYEAGDQIHVVDTELGLDFMFTVESYDVGSYGSLYGTEQTRRNVTETLAYEINDHLNQASRSSAENAQYVDGKLVFEYGGAHTLTLTAVNGTPQAAVAGQWTLPLTAAALGNEFQLYYSVGGHGNSVTHVVTAEEMVGDPVANVAAKLAQLLAAATSDLGAPVFTASANASGLITITALHAGAGTDLYASLANASTSTYTNTNRLVQPQDASGQDNTQAITKHPVKSTTESASVPDLQLITVHEATAGVESSLATMDTINGLTIGQDRIEIRDASFNHVTVRHFTRVADIASSGDLATSLSTAFAAIGVHDAGIVVIDAGDAAGTYLYVNDGTAAFSATDDVFVKLTGLNGLNAVGDLGTSLFVTPA
jgi:hypothetical protein